MSLLVLSTTTIVFTVPLFALWWYKKGTFTGNIKRDKISVLASQAFGPRRAIALVEVDGERLLLGVTDNNIGLIRSFPGQFAAALQTAETTSDEVLPIDDDRVVANAFQETH